MEQTICLNCGDISPVKVDICDKCGGVDFRSATKEDIKDISKGKQIKPNPENIPTEQTETVENPVGAANDGKVEEVKEEKKEEKIEKSEPKKENKKNEEVKEEKKEEKKDK